MKDSEITPELQKRIEFARERQRQLREELNSKGIETNTNVVNTIDIVEPAKHEEEPVRCPRCQSTQLTANQKGYGLGKGVAGGLLLGPVGLLGGFIGSKKVVITCLKCGHQWKP